MVKMCDHVDLTLAMVVKNIKEFDGIEQTAQYPVESKI